MPFVSKSQTCCFFNSPTPTIPNHCCWATNKTSKHNNIFLIIHPKMLHFIVYDPFTWPKIIRGNKKYIMKKKTEKKAKKALNFGHAYKLGARSWEAAPGSRFFNRAWCTPPPNICSLVATVATVTLLVGHLTPGNISVSRFRLCVCYSAKVACDFLPLLQIFDVWYIFLLICINYNHLTSPGICRTPRCFNTHYYFFFF